MAIFPLSCGGCNRPLPTRPQYLLCPLCTHALLETPEPASTKLPAGGRSYVPYLYGGPLESMISAAKFRGRVDLSRALGHLLLAFTRRSNIIKRCDLIAPIPLSPLRHLLRGYNQSEEIASVLSQKHQIPMLTHWRRSHRRPQHQLNRQERLTNLQGAFKNPQGIENKRVLIIDDVTTTGSTLKEASQVLLDAGARRVDAMAIAQSNWSYLKS